MTDDNPTRFDDRAPLPDGVNLLEASAGTGKTHTITTLAVRYVAQGVPLDALLIVTFTRAATGELRDRVRSRLAGVERALELSLAGVRPEDELAAWLAGAPEREVAARRDRLGRALAGYDSATITTIHGFCQHVLEGLGTLGDVARDVEFVDDLRDLTKEVVDDLYLRRFRHVSPAPFNRTTADAVGRAALGNPLAPLAPADAPPDSIPGQRRDFAMAVREEVERRKRRGGVQTFDDLLTRVYSSLQDPHTGEAACVRLRQRYRVALVDEFQDTDPVQWGIMLRAFGQSSLVLIGDPKQAIYAFRGGDVQTYLAAAREATERRTLSVNWRSDQRLVDAYAALFGEARLGHPEIRYRAVRAAEREPQVGLRGPGADAALRIRVVRRDGGDLELDSRKKYAKVGPARQLVANDLAADVARLLAANTEIARPSAGGVRWDAVRPGDIAVLVRRNEDATNVRDALDARGVPGVISGAGSVFSSPAADEWLRLLEAIERPASAGRASSAALTSFVGWDAQRLAAKSEDDAEALHAQLHGWREVLAGRGVAALTETAMVANDVPARVLASEDGERLLTDLRHVAQLLHTQAASRGLGIVALLGWLRDRIAEAADEGLPDEEATRRLESDAAAVQVLTVHRSKGLEFPIVYCPFLWEPGWVPRKHEATPVFHAPERTVDVGGREDPGFDDRYERSVEEGRGEDLRLLYVALTRARHQAVAWWVGSDAAKNAPLTRLLLRRDDDGNVAPSGPLPSDDEVADALAARATIAPGAIGVEEVGTPDDTVWTPPVTAVPTLEAATLGRAIDTSWRRTSYSAVTEAAHEEWVASEPEGTGVEDEPDLNAGALTGSEGDEALRSTPLPLGGLAGGTAFGSLVHQVLERVDFSAPDLAGELHDTLEAVMRWHSIELDRAELVAGLVAAIETPIGGSWGDAGLRELRTAGRRDEMEFELPLAGGDTPHGAVPVSRIAELLDAHLAASDPLAEYPSRLVASSIRGELRGFLTGSIDLVARLESPRGEATRFAVVDYKTNRLGGTEEPTAWHYRPDALAAAMMDAHYPVQALFYATALHRYLRWRLPGYDPAANLAGVQYLFLRGMAGPGTPRVDGVACGVFSWSPPPGLIAELSDVLDGESVPA